LLLKKPIFSFMSIQYMCKFIPWRIPSQTCTFPFLSSTWYTCTVYTMYMWRTLKAKHLWVTKEFVRVRCLVSLFSSLYGLTTWMSSIRGSKYVNLNILLSLSFSSLYCLSEVVKMCI
jgi:hypothetical protein